MTETEKKLENLKADLETIEKMKIRDFINVDLIEWEPEIMEEMKKFQIKIISQWYRTKKKSMQILTEYIQILTEYIQILKQEIKKK